jgi:diguanylate cyclase (GGDEF)-like protein
VEERRALRAQAVADPLTGLANRRGLAARFAEAAGAGGRVGLVLADLDGFKAVNDAHGHDVGDQLLLAAAGRLAAAAGPGELPARLGGDEFALLLPALPADPAAAASRAAARAAAVAHALACPYAVDGLRLRVGASVGAAAALTGPAGLAGLLRAADQAMYRAKRDRRRAVGEPAGPAWPAGGHSQLDEAGAPARAAGRAGEERAAAASPTAPGGPPHEAVRPR